MYTYDRTAAKKETHQAALVSLADDIVSEIGDAATSKLEDYAEGLVKSLEGKFSRDLFTHDNYSRDRFVAYLAKEIQKTDIAQELASWIVEYLEG